MANPCKGRCTLIEGLIAVKRGRLTSLDSTKNSRRYCTTCRVWVHTNKLDSNNLRCPCCHFLTRGRTTNYSAEQREHRFGEKIKRY